MDDSKREAREASSQVVKTWQDARKRQEMAMREKARNIKWCVCDKVFGKVSKDEACLGCSAEHWCERRIWYHEECLPATDLNPPPGPDADESDPWFCCERCTEIGVPDIPADEFIPDWSDDEEDWEDEAVSNKSSGGGSQRRPEGGGGGTKRSRSSGAPKPSTEQKRMRQPEPKAPKIPCAREDCRKVGRSPSSYCSDACCLATMGGVIDAIRAAKRVCSAKWLLADGTESDMLHPPKIEVDKSAADLRSGLVGMGYWKGDGLAYAGVGAVDVAPTSKRFRGFKDDADLFCQDASVRKMGDAEIRAAVEGNLEETFQFVLAKLRTRNTITMASILAAEVEDELFRKYEETGHEYRKHHTLLVRNLKHRHNEKYVARLLANEMSVVELLSMTPQQLATLETQSQREELRNFQIEAAKRPRDDVVDEYDAAEAVDVDTIEDSSDDETTDAPPSSSGVSSPAVQGSKISLPPKPSPQADVKFSLHQKSGDGSGGNGLLDLLKKPTGGSTTSPTAVIKVDSTLLSSGPSKSFGKVRLPSPEPEAYGDPDEDSSYANVMILNTEGGFEVGVHKSGGIHIHGQGCTSDRYMQGLTPKRIDIGGRTKVTELHRYLKEQKKKGRKMLSVFAFEADDDKGSPAGYKKLCAEMTAEEKVSVSQKFGNDAQIYIVPPDLKSQVGLLKRYQPKMDKDANILYGVLVSRDEGQAEYVDRAPTFWSKFRETSESHSRASSVSSAPSKSHKTPRFPSSNGASPEAKKPRAAEPLASTAALKPAVSVTAPSTQVSRVSAKTDNSRPPVSSTLPAKDADASGEDLVAKIEQTARWCHEKGATSIEVLRKKPDAESMLPFIFVGRPGYSEFRSKLKELIEAHKAQKVGLKSSEAPGGGNDGASGQHNAPRRSRFS